MGKREWGEKFKQIKGKRKKERERKNEVKIIWKGTIR